MKRTAWWLAQRLHSFDYAVLLPLMARLPFALGYALSAWRGRLNGIFGRDWRSMALETRHVARQATQAYQSLFPSASPAEVRSRVRERCATESREEFEGRLIAARRADRLSRVIAPDTFLDDCRQANRGLVLLTPHLDSFTLGIVFLGMAGLRVNAMSSTVTADPRVDPAVRRHFDEKYRGMEAYMNGGQILNREEGQRPFYQMLKRGECVVILADAPALPGSTAVEPDFLGGRRSLAGGALRMAAKTGSALGAFVCRYESPGHYRLHGGPVLDAGNPLALDTVYGFLAQEILAAPGRWWAVDLLPAMPLIDANSP